MLEYSQKSENKGEIIIMNSLPLRYCDAGNILEHYTKAVVNISDICVPSFSYAIAYPEKELGVKLFEKEDARCLDHQMWLADWMWNVL